MILAPAPDEAEELEQWRQRAARNASQLYALWHTVSEWCDARKDDPAAQELRAMITWQPIAPAALQ